MVDFGEYITLLVELHEAIAADNELAADVIRDLMDGPRMDDKERVLVNKLSEALYFWHEN